MTVTEGKKCNCQEHKDCRIRIRLTEEIEATESLLREGDPFFLTRKDYLENLKSIGGKDLQ